MTDTEQTTGDAPLALADWQRDILAKLRDSARRYRHLPGWDAGWELGDWTQVHRLIDPASRATREGLPDPPGTWPEGSVVATPADLSAIRRLSDDYYAIRDTAHYHGITLTRSVTPADIARLATLMREEGAASCE